MALQIFSSFDEAIRAQLDLTWLGWMVMIGKSHLVLCQ